MTAQPKIRMTVSEFVDWAMAQPSGRYELVQGEVVAMAPERVRHNLTKLAVARALGDAVTRAGLPCTVFTDGMTVRIDERTAREPDASVRCGVEQDDTAVLLEAPMIVVEVVSPSSERTDTSQKLVDYFSLPSVRHYLVVDPKQRAVIHHARDVTGGIHTLILRDGALDLTPPGMSVPVADMLPAKPIGDDT